MAEQDVTGSQRDGANKDNHSKTSNDNSKSPETEETGVPGSAQVVEIVCIETLMTTTSGCK